MSLSLADVVAIVAVLGAAVGWLLKLERNMNNKVSHKTLKEAIDGLGEKLTEHADADAVRFDKTIERTEAIVERRHQENRAVLTRQDQVLEKISTKLDEHADKASKFRHEQRDEVNALNLKLVAALQGRPPR